MSPPGEVTLYDQHAPVRGDVAIMGSWTYVKHVDGTQDAYPMDAVRRVRFAPETFKVGQKVRVTGGPTSAVGQITLILVREGQQQEITVSWPEWSKWGVFGAHQITPA